MLFVSPFKVPLINAENVQLHRRLEKFLIFCLKITKNKSMNLVKGAWVISQSLATLTVTYPGARDPILVGSLYWLADSQFEAWVWIPRRHFRYV